MLIRLSPLLAAIAALPLLATSAAAQTRIGGISTNFRWFGPDDRVVVERYDDPDIPNVSCYLSRAETGGVKGGLGLAEDPSRFAIACRATGPVTLPPNLPRKAIVAFASASLFFKTFQIHRMVDRQRGVLLYVVISTKLIKGSPYNAISAIATR